MKQAAAKQKAPLKVLIFAQSGALAGDLAALLSGSHQVDLLTNSNRILNTINPQIDVLVLVKDPDREHEVDPLSLLAAASRAHCRIVLLGDWREAVWSRCQQGVLLMPKLPSPTILLDAITRDF